MTRREKLLAKILRGTADTNIGFDDLRGLLLGLGFAERLRGSHHIFTREGVPEILNLQPGAAGMAKPYQVRQVRQVVLRHGLAPEQDDDDA
jgi:hypothetical protein